MLINPNPMLLNESIIIEKYNGTDDWDNPKYDKPITLSNVRMDRDKVYVGSGNARTVVAEGVVLVFAFNQTELNINDEWLQSKVTDSFGKDYVIKRIITNLQDVNTNIYNWELEVI